MNDQDTILVLVGDEAVTRGGGPGVQELKVEVLADNVNLFLGQIEKMMANAPEEINGKFKLTEFTIGAEISATGSLILLGAGVEASGKAGITFTFERK
jgi:hypothetical protein